MSQKFIDAASPLTSRIWSRRLIEGHLNSNYNTIDSSEILLSWCIYYFTKAVQLYLILLPSFFKVFPQQERMGALSSVSSMNSFGQNPSFRSWICKHTWIRKWKETCGGTRRVALKIVVDCVAGWMVTYMLRIYMIYSTRCTFIRLPGQSTTRGLRWFRLALKRWKLTTIKRKTF